MKKFNLSLIALFAMTTFSHSNALETPILNEFYIGGAYGLLGASYKEDMQGDIYAISSDESFPQAMLQMGYKINPYFAFEGRYFIGMNDQSWENTFDEGATAQIDTWAVYTKFMMPLGEPFNFYTLLGYSESTYRIEGEKIENGDDAYSGFSWGVGANVSFAEHFSVFVDYVALYDNYETNYRGNDSNVRIESVNIGASYTF
ncbi:putative outer membrane protein A [hydrothermal vent metagenome]|uniref:Putative outer membrane protein A n=1 Tax=hydrothermal vent metagenome TaxID=652676 RepID=A0A1W1CP62_9ZZZZ